jgi:hypothetical protein
MTSKGWIGVDLDRTLAEHLEGTGAPVPGKPIAPMVARVKRWLAAGYDVRIFTARVQDQKDHHLAFYQGESWANLNHTQRMLVRMWCLEHLGQELPITNCKDMHLWCLFDDRAVHVMPNTGHMHIIGCPPELDDPYPCA